MKNRLLIISISCFMFSLNASATRETGGTQAAPTAVVIQGHLQQNGAFDLEGWNKALMLLDQHTSEGRVVVSTQREEDQYPDRTYLCIEYKNYYDFMEASEEFKQLLADNLSIEVVQNSSCQ